MHLRTHYINNLKVIFGILLALTGAYVCYESLGHYVPVSTMIILGSIGWSLLLCGIALTVQEMDI